MEHKRLTSGDDGEMAGNRMRVAEDFKSQCEAAKAAGVVDGHCTVFVNRQSLRIWAGAWEYAAIRRVLAPRDPNARLWLGEVEITGQFISLAGGEAFFTEGRSAGN